jgi:hypothetical protein
MTSRLKISSASGDLSEVDELSSPLRGYLSEPWKPVCGEHSVPVESKQATPRSVTVTQPEKPAGIAGQDTLHPWSVEAAILLQEVDDLLRVRLVVPDTSQHHPVRTEHQVANIWVELADELLQAAGIEPAYICIRVENFGIVAHISKDRRIWARP